MTDDFAERLASASPTPGGGAAAARTGRHAAALLRMSLAITLGKTAEPDAGSRAALEEAALEAGKLQARFEELETLDMAAFERYLEALRLPRSTPGEKAHRKAERARAAAVAALVPLDVMETAATALALSEKLLDPASGGALKAESDIGCAIELAWAAFRAAEMNVAVNLPEIEPGTRNALELRWRHLLRRARLAHETARSRIAGKLGLPE
jgi:formiminotetrahydrofolate cyclodeaminase